MIARLFTFQSPAEELREERERVAAKKPHLSVICPDPRPEPDMFVWKDPALMWERGQ